MKINEKFCKLYLFTISSLQFNSVGTYLSVKYFRNYRTKFYLTVNLLNSPPKSPNPPSFPSLIRTNN